MDFSWENDLSEKISFDLNLLSAFIYFEKDDVEESTQDHNCLLLVGYREEFVNFVYQ